MHEVLQPIVVYLEAFYWQLPLEGVGVELTNFIVINVQFLQLLQILEAIHLHYFVAAGLEDLQFSHFAKVESIEVLEEVG